MSKKCLSSKFVYFFFKYIIFIFFIILFFILIFKFFSATILFWPHKIEDNISSLFICILPFLFFVYMFFSTKLLYWNGVNIIVNEQEIPSIQIKKILMMPKGNHNGIFIILKNKKLWNFFIYSILPLGDVEREIVKTLKIKYDL